MSSITQRWPLLCECFMILKKFVDAHERCGRPYFKFFALLVSILVSRSCHYLLGVCEDFFARNDRHPSATEKLLQLMEINFLRINTLLTLYKGKKSIFGFGNHNEHETFHHCTVGWLF